MPDLQNPKQPRRALIEVPKNIQKFSKRMNFDKELESQALLLFQLKNNEFPNIFYSYEIFSLALLYYTYRIFDSTMDLNMYGDRLWNAKFYRERHVKKAYYHICKIIGSPRPINHYELQMKIIEGIENNRSSNYPKKNFNVIKNEIKKYYKSNPKVRLSNTQFQELINKELSKIDPKMTITHAGNLIHWGRQEIIRNLEN